MRSWFVAQCGENNVSPGVAGMRIHDALLQWADRTVVSGHFHTHHGDELPHDRRSVVVLRDPVTRFLSDYFFWQNNNDTRLLDARHRTDDLDAHIARIAGRGPENAALQIGMLYPLGTRSEARLSLDEMLSAAKLALDSFDLVGVQASLDDFVCMIAAQMGWPQFEVQRHNITQRRDAMANPSAEQRRKIARLLEAEIELYEHARRRFRHDRRRAIGGGAAAVEAATAKEPVTAAPGKPAPRNFGDRRCEIVRASVRGRLSNTEEVMCGEEIDLELDIVAHVAIDELTVGFTFRDERDALLFGTNSRLLGNAYELSPGRYLARFTLLNRFGAGHYRVDASLIRDLSHYDGCYHWHELATRFEVFDVASNYFEGRFMLDPNFDLIAVDDNAQVQRSTPTTECAMVRSFGRVNPPLSQFRAAIELLSPLPVLPAATDSIVQLRVQNLGEETWPASGRAAPVCIAYRWYSTAGEMLVADGVRSTLPGDVSCGQAMIAPLLVRAPDTPGSYQLVISLVQESVAWFIEKDPESGCWVSVDVA